MDLLEKVGYIDLFGLCEMSVTELFISISIFPNIEFFLKINFLGLL